MKQKKRTWESLRAILRFAARHWLLIGLAMLAMVAYAAGEARFLLLVEPFVTAITTWRETGEAATGVSAEKLHDIGKVALLLAPYLAITAFAQVFLRQRLVWRLIVDMRNAICAAVLPQSLSFFESRRSGDLMSRITNDVSRAQAVFRQLFAGIPEHALHFLMGILIAAMMDWKLLLISVITLPVIFWPVTRMAKRIRRYGREGLVKLSDLTDLMTQMFSGIRIIKAFKMEDAEIQEFHRTNRKFLGKMMKMVIARALSSGSVELAIRLFLGAAMLIATALIVRGHIELNFGRLCVFLGGIYYAFNAVRRLVKAYNELQVSIPAADRIFELLSHVPSLQDAPDAVTLGGVEKGITFKNVSFAYDTEPVLQDISFEAERGETVAVVGRSGSGKSTLIALIARFYDVTSGAVEIDGIDVRKITRDSLLDRIAIVAQQTFLFNRSITENIRYGRRDASMEEVEAAARAANVHDFITSLPEGYDTLCGEFGTKLSGGQRQRVAIARALLKNADILMLDEAMAGLDAESESLVREALQTLMRDRTTFVVTHDLATIQNADRILVLQGGRLAAQGTHEELMAKGGEYGTLYALQFSNLSGPPRETSPASKES